MTETWEADPSATLPTPLFEVSEGGWYGWQRPEFLLADHAALPPPERALVEFPPRVAAVKFDNDPAGGELEGSLLIALFGDEAPLTAPAGRRSDAGSRPSTLRHGDSTP